MKKQPEEIFRKHGDRLRMSEAVEYGITRYMLYSLRNKGVIEQVSRGIYRLSQSVHADRFILKGALMLRVWCSPELRPTTYRTASGPWF